MEDFQYRHALDELDVLGELVEELVELEEELDDARELEIFVLKFLREVLLHVHELFGLGWQWLDLNLGGLVAPQVLELLTVVVLDVVPRRLVHLDVVALAPLVRVDVGVAVPELAQRLFWLDIVDVLASRCLKVG